MAGSFKAQGFDMSKGFEGMWEAMEQFRSTFEKRVGTARVGKGDVRAAILALLAEQPMHGYQIIHEIEERSGGSWKPSAGSVYPTLQLLADEGLISAEESNGRKTYSLTEAGRAVVDSDGTSSVWDASDHKDGGNRYTALPKAGVELAKVAAEVNRSGNPEQIKQAVAALEEARRKLYAILAEG